MKFIELIRKDRIIRLAFIVSVVIWMLLAFMNIFGFSNYYTVYQEQRQDDIVHSIAPQLESYSERLDLFATTFVTNDTGISKDDFDTFAETLLNGDDTVEFITFSPHGTVENVYPYDASTLGEEVIQNFSIDEFALFSDALENDSYFITYVYEEEVLTKMKFHKSNVVNDEFQGLVTITVDVNKFVSSIPNENINEEVVILTSDEVFIKSSSIYDEHFKFTSIDIDGQEFLIGLEFRGSYFIRTIMMVVLATLFVTFPLVAIFIVFYEDSKRTKKLIKEVEYGRTYSIDTNLKNARSFYRDIEELIEKEEAFYLALGIFNNIKYINDKYGHDLGLEVVREAVRLITGVLRSNTELYHFGGEEYILVLKTDAEGETKNILKRVLKIFDRDIVIDRIRTNISMTLGVVKHKDHGKTIDELIKNAHITISNSHIMNSNAFAFFKKDTMSNLITNQDFDIYVKNLNLELFEVYLMPIIDVETNLIVGFECLTRAFNEFDEMLDTESVVNSLERNGRIQELDEIVFTKMLRMMRRLNNEFPNNDYFLSVNASALSFNEKYVDTVMALYEQEGFEKGTIVLELTESYQVDDYDYLIRLFNRLNSVGIKTAIDDFGSGYSSLSYISKFPIYAIKVDKEYVRDYLTNDFNRTLFMTLRSIAEVLDCKLVAEGVDEPETLNFLRKNHCELYQGYLFSKGVTFEDSIEMIKKNLLEYNKE